MNRTLRFQHLSHELTRPIASFVHSTNLYSQHHPTLDLPNAADIRLSNLTHYLNDHQHARIALIGEAVGYAGCRFTGIPFTCEAQLREWDDPRYRITSLRGEYDERSARCVWQVLGRRDDVILWNVFPWHPHSPGQPMSNRKPTAAEIRAGMQVLELFLAWLQPEQVIAVGRVAEWALREMNVPATYVRHPSHGGQRAFQSAVHSIINTQDSQHAKEPLERQRRRGPQPARPARLSLAPAGRRP